MDCPDVNSSKIMVPDVDNRLVFDQQNGAKLAESRELDRSMVLRKSGRNFGAEQLLYMGQTPRFGSFCSS